MSILATGFAAIALFQSTSADAARAEQTRLNTCTEKIEVNPEEAYEDGLAWLYSGNRPAARYCTALALAALGQEAEAAARLEELANADDAGSLQDRIIYLAQAGNAWLAAEYPDAAIVTLDNAIKLSKNDPDLYKDRAAAHILLEQWPQAISDLNSALSIVPFDVEALKMRATALTANDNPEAALLDVEAAMRAAPEDISVLVVRGQVREAIRRGKVVRLD